MYKAHSIYCRNETQSNVLERYINVKKATSWTNLFMPYANKGANQPTHPRGLVSSFVVRCLDCIMSILVKSKISRLFLVSVAEQADLSHTWSAPGTQTQKTGFFMMWLKWSNEKSFNTLNELWFKDHYQKQMNNWKCPIKIPQMPVPAD